MVLFAHAPESHVSVGVLALLVLAFLAALVFWGAMLARYRAGRSILPREPRAGVPWQVSDLLIVVVGYLLLSAVGLEAIGWWLGPEKMEPVAMTGEDGQATAHAVLKVMASGDPWVLVLCVVVVVVVAPVVEEFLFRLLLQGWLETSVERWSLLLPNLRRVLSGAAGPILCSSLLFAAAHFRVAGPEYRAERVLALLLTNAVVSVIVVAFAVLWLRRRVGATSSDLGLVWGKLAADVRLGLWSLVGLLGPVYAIQIGGSLLLPKYVAPDPIPLFFLAVGLGVLYNRTHRLVPCIVLHAGLNAASLTLAWATL